MGLFPAAPRVEIRALGECFAGESTTLEILITAKEDLTIGHVDLRVFGEQGWRLTTSHQISYPSITQRLRGLGILPKGTTTFLHTFVLPDDMPPTHFVGVAWAELKVRVDISIPLWPDPTYGCSIPVRRLAVEPVVRTPVTMHGDAEENEPRIDIGLASSQLIAGETVFGSITVFNMHDRESRDIKVRLVPTLKLGRAGHRAALSRGPGSHVVVTLPPGMTGKTFPFQLPLPSRTTPSFVAETQELSWAITASPMGFGEQAYVAVPIAVVDTRTGSVTSPLAAPLLGGDRLAEVVLRFAEANHWRADGADVVRELETGRLRMAVAFHGSYGTFLIAQITYPSLGLVLQVSPSSTLNHLLFHDIEANLEAWDRVHHVTARSEEQALPVVAAIAPLLLAAQIPGKLIYWGDHAMAFECAVTELHDLDEAQLIRIDETLQGLARAIAAARATIQPPKELAIDLASWHDLAKWLSSELVVGDLSIRGKHGGLVVDVALGWNGRKPGDRIRVIVGAAEVASARADGVHLELAHPTSDSPVSEVPQLLAAQLATWPADMVDLRIADGCASAAWMLPTAGSRELDAAPIRGLVMMLSAVLAALDPSAGPYR